MPRLTVIEAEYRPRIQEAAGRFGDHEDMAPGRILQWLAQFANPHLPFATKILGNITYFNAFNIRAMTAQLVRIVREEFRHVDPLRIIFVPVGDPGSSANVIARALRDVRDGARPRIVSMADLERTDAATLGAIVFIDDFSGTGDQLVEWWENVEPLVKPKRAPVAVAVLVMNGRARQRIEEFADRALCVAELDDGANVLSDQSRTFEHTEKQLLLDYCGRTECNPALIRGYGSCGLLLAFKHGCPNDSLPILWYESRRWRSLFRRSAI